MEWQSTVRLYRTQDGYEVRQFAGEHRKVDLLPSGQPAWRTLAGLLVAQDEMWAIPEEALPEVQCSGCHGWQADVLILSWARYDVHKEVNLAAIAHIFPDAWLEDMAGRYGTLVPRLGERGMFVEDLYVLSLHLRNALSLREQLRDLMKEYRCNDSATPLYSLLVALRAD